MIKLFAEHRVAANLLMIMMIMAGVWAVRTMPSMLDPPTNFPLVIIEITWQGAAAEDIEALVTKPIEQQLRTVNELHELTSRTTNGSTRINVRFHFDADMTVALDQVKQRVANIRNLPVEIEPPVIRRYIDIEPISELLISSDGELSELIPLVRQFEKELIARGAEGVRYWGIPTEEIALQVSGENLQELGMTLDELAEEVARVSQNVPAGTVGRGQGARALRSLDQRRDPMAFENLHLHNNMHNNGQNSGQLLRLGDIAEVVRRPQRGQPRLTTNARPAIEMMVWRSTSADAHQGDELVQQWLNEVRPTLPAGVVITETANIWRLIGSQLDMLLSNGLSGLLLVIGVLFLFLNARAGYWVTVGIPVSFMAALALFYVGFGYGISIIALIGFIMALGIVVDDAIVVGEDIVALHERGMPASQAAAAGAQRMWVPVMTSSLTTMAAFIPLLVIGGIVGDMILALPTVLLCVIVASLIECFLVLPNHLRTSLEKHQGQHNPAWRCRFERWFTHVRDDRFIPLVDKALAHPVNTLLASAGGMLIAVSLLASQHVGFNLVTGFDFESIEANVEYAVGTTERQKLNFIEQLETALETTHVEHQSRNVLGWTAKYNLARFNNDSFEGEQFASVSAQYAFEEDRTLSPQAFVDAWRTRIQRPSYVEQLTIGVRGGTNNGNPDISLVLRGNSLDQLKQGAEELSAMLGSYPGVSNVTDDLPYGKSQIIFEMTATGRSLGLTAVDIGTQLRAAYAGRRVQIFNEQDNEVEVRVMATDAERDNIGALQQFPIRLADSSFVPLSSVARLYNRRGIDVIRHSNSELAATVSADVNADENNAMAIVEDIQQRLDPLLERHNLTFGLGGQSRQDQILMGTMALGAVLTLILIYLILAWVFSSYLWPLAIMMAIPFGMTGAIIGHWLTGWDVGAMSLLAFFSLTGIVVNDSIVLISFLRRDVDAGKPVRTALREAARLRFRAVILTSLTTVAGLLPLMFETSTMSMYFAPIAVTLCFGLSFATALVLVVIPALILLLEDSKKYLQRATARVTKSFIGPDHAQRH